MAVTPRHGHKTRPLVDEKDLSPFLTSVTPSASMDPSEVTTFDSSGDREYIKGMRDGTISFDGLFASASTSTAATDDIANFLDDSLGGSTKHVYTVEMERGSTGGRAAMMRADNTSYDIASPANDVITISVDAQASDGYAGGRILRPLTQSTSTGSGSGVLTPGTTTAGGTTGGGVGHLHVTAFGSTENGATVKIQHSTSGSTWADLITFSTLGGDPTFERSTVAGTVKEQLRSTIVSLSSGSTSSTGKSLTAAAAFARNNHKT